MTDSSYAEGYTDILKSENRRLRHALKRVAMVLERLDNGKVPTAAMARKIALEAVGRKYAPPQRHKPVTSA